MHDTLTESSIELEMTKRVDQVMGTFGVQVRTISTSEDLCQLYGVDLN